MRERRGSVSRRRLLGLAGSGAVGAGLGVAGTRLVDSPSGTAAPAQTTPAGLRRANGAVAPHDGHQPGIAEPRPAAAQFVALDVDRAHRTPDARRRVAALLREWTTLAADIADGSHQADTEGSAATGLRAASATVTVGLGTTLLPALGRRDRQPPALADLPAFPGDALDPDRSGGDLVLQVCAEDPLVVTSAVQAVVDAARGTAHVRWSMRGFSTSLAAKKEPSATPRNLMGHKDGSNNPEPGSGLFDATVWAKADGPEWMVGGSYLVFRRIRTMLDRWYGEPPEQREAVIGRTLDTGAPLGLEHESDDPDLTMRDDEDEHVIPDDAHIRLASATRNDGFRIFRRPFNYDDGVDASGERDAGLLFAVYQADPRRGFVPLQRRLAEHDALNEYIRHESSAVFAVPPAATGSAYLAQAALE